MASQKVQVSMGITGVTAVTAGLKKVSESVTSVISQASRLTLGLSGIGGALSVAGFAAGIKNAISLGSQLSDVADRTDMTAGEVLVMQQAFKDAGVSADAMQTAMAYLNKALAGARDGSKEYVLALEKLGLTYQDLISMKPADRFIAVSDAIAKLKSSVDRTDVAMKLFSRSGQQLLSLFRNPEAFSNAKRTIGSMADLMTKKATLFDKISNSLNNVGVKSQQFFAGFASEIGGSAEAALDKFTGLDFTPVGQKAGAKFADAFEKISKGKIGEGIISAIDVATPMILDKFSIVRDGFQALLLDIDWDAIGLKLLECFGKAGKGFTSFFYGLGDKLRVGFFGTESDKIEKQIAVEEKRLESYQKAMDSYAAKNENLPFMRNANSYAQTLARINELKSQLQVAQNIDDDWLRKNYPTVGGQKGENFSNFVKEKLSSIMPTTSEKTEISILEKTEAAIKKTWTGLTSYTQQTITNIKTKCAGYYIESLEKDALAFEEQRLSKVGEYLEFESEIRDVQSKKNILNSEFWLSDIAHRKEALKLVDAQNEIYKKQEINLNDQITLLDLQIEKKKELLRYETDPKKQTSLENEIQRLSGQRAGLSESGKDLGRQQRESYSGLNFDPTSFKDNLQSQMAELYDSFGTLASNMANTITSTVASMKSSMSDFFYDTLTGTKTLKDALASFGKSVAQSMLRAATDSIASFIMRNTVCLALNSAFNLGIIAQNSSANSSMLANEMSTASMTATAWTAPAILKSIATWGVAAAIGVAAIVGVMAAFGGFASGGRVEGKKQLAWFNEDGSEYVVSSKSPRSNDRYLDAANRGVNLDNLMAASPTATGLTSGQNTTRESQPEQRVVKNVTVRSHYELREEMKKAGVVQLVKTSLQREGLI